MGIGLLVVDMLTDFVRENGKLPVPIAESLVGNIQELREGVYNAGGNVFYANDAHAEDDPEFESFPPHAIKGTPGAEVIYELAPKEGDVVLEKQDLSVYTNPKARQAFIDAGITDLYVAGVATEYCVRGATLDGLEDGLNIHVVVDAIAGVDEIVLPDGVSVPQTKGKVAYACMEMAAVGAKPAYTADVLKELEALAQ